MSSEESKQGTSTDTVILAPRGLAKEVLDCRLVPSILGVIEDNYQVAAGASRGGQH